MMHTSDVDRVSAQQGIPVLLAVGASLDNLAVIRSMVESVLLTADFSLADAADVKLGVDEICTQIIARSSESDPLACSLLTGPLGVAGEIHGVLRAGLDLATDGFGWHVVQTVTDAVSVDIAGESADREVCVRFTKVRAAD